MSIWHIEEYKPRAPRGSSALEAAYVWQNDRQLPDLEAGFRGISSDQQPYPLPSYLFLENAARLPQVDPHAWGPEYEQVILNREDHNEGYQTSMDVKSLRQKPVSMDGVPEGGLPQEMEESEVERKKREREMIQKSQQKGEQIRQKRQKREFGQEEEGRRQVKQEEEGFGMEEMLKEEEEKGMKEEEEKPEAFFFDPSPMNKLQEMIEEMKTDNQELKQSLLQELEQMKQLPLKNRQNIQVMEGYLSKLKSQIASYVQGQDQQVQDEMNQKIEQMEQQLSQSMQQAGQERQEIKQEMGQISEQVVQMARVMDENIELIAKELQKQDIKGEKLVQLQKQLSESMEQVKEYTAQIPFEEIQERLNQMEDLMKQLGQRVGRAEQQQTIVKVVRSKNSRLYSYGFQKTMSSVGANTESKEAFVPNTHSFFANDAYSLEEDVSMLSSSPLQSPEKAAETKKIPGMIKQLGTPAKTKFKAAQSGKEISPMKTRAQRKKSI
jgi:ABC-type transporter Mla subunit MlaD